MMNMEIPSFDYKHKQIGNKVSETIVEFPLKGLKELLSYAEKAKEKITALQAQNRKIALTLRHYEETLNAYIDPGDCKWTEGEPEEGAYLTGCGNAFIFAADGPEENGAKYCMYCGKKIKVG